LNRLKLFLLPLLFFITITCAVGKNTPIIKKQRVVVKKTVQKDYIWRWYGGKWKIVDSNLLENRKWSVKWYYNYLMNFNTILSKDIITPKDIIFSLKLKDPMISKKKKRYPKFFYYWGARSPFKGNFFYFFNGLSFTGDKKHINKVTLFYSSRKNDKISKYAKKNYKINNIISKTVSLDYGKPYKIRIKINRDRIIIFINNKRILSKKSKFLLASKGKTGFCSRYAKLSLDSVKIISDEKIIIDNFDNPKSLYIPVRRVKIRKKVKK